MILGLVIVSEDGQKKAPKPSNQIDLQALTTFPHVSSDYMSDRVRNKFRTYRYVYEDVEVGGEVVRQIVSDGQGNPKLELVRDWWASMELFTQDLRLGNLNVDEAFYVRYNLDLATDILTALPESFSKSALISFERATSVVETSQSKGGFLRRMFNTFFQNVSSKEESPVKTSFFGRKKSKGD